MLVAGLILHQTKVKNDRNHSWGLEKILAYYTQMPHGILNRYSGERFLHSMQMSKLDITLLSMHVLSFSVGFQEQIFIYLIES